ncbi:Uncharacterized protein HZ326_3268 [Fusarium oxysporum f. sp. albedinis]|nr:Uncharacterized protein HZ326_3268 [Fusarium oxysporum f. sp. albedinis]
MTQRDSPSPCENPTTAHRLDEFQNSSYDKNSNLNGCYRGFPNPMVFTPSHGPCPMLKIKAEHHVVGWLKDGWPDSESAGSIRQATAPLPCPPSILASPGIHSASRTPLYSVLLRAPKYAVIELYEEWRMPCKNVIHLTAILYKGYHLEPHPVSTRIIKLEL